MILPLIHCTKLSKNFGERCILRDLSCSILPGKTLAVMGRSGSGKSTFLRLLSLLERADGGDIWLKDQQYVRDGIPILKPAVIRRRIAMVFQQFNLFPNRTVLQNCMLGPVHALGREGNAVRAEARQLLDELEIGGTEDRYPDTLSGGETQRVALARALLMHPEVLLLDEVTSSLDPESIHTVIRAIKSIRRLEQGRDISIVLVTHLLTFAQSFADSIAFLHEGRFTDIFPANEFREKAVSQAARTLIFQAENNWISEPN